MPINILKAVSGEKITGNVEKKSYGQYASKIFINPFQN